MPCWAGARNAPASIMLRRAVLPLLWLSACSFEKEVPGPDGGDVVMPNPTARCIGQDMRLCVDFEGQGPEMVKDAFGSALMPINVLPALRDAAEGAAELMGASVVKVTNSNRLDIPTNLTIEMWTKPSGAPPKSGDQQAGLFTAAGQYELNFEWDRRIECRIFGGGGDDNLDSSLQITDAWHHVACTYDGAEMRVYVDGQLAGCKSTNRTIATMNHDGAAIGANMMGPGFKNYFVGDLDNVHLYARTLTAAEICSGWGHHGCTDTCPSEESSSGS